MTATMPAIDPGLPVTGLLFALRDLAGEAAVIDLRAADDDEAATRARSGELADLLERTIRVLVDLQATQVEDAQDTVVFELAPEPDAWISRAQDAARPRIADVCFAGGLELRRVQRELAAAIAATDQLVAAETARRKLRRAIRAVLEAAREAGVGDVIGGEHQGHHQVADVASGLAVRRLYAVFRRSLREPAEPTAEAVLTAVRYAAGAMAILVASPDYPDVRASDRAVLRDLRDRALRWARGDRGLTAGVNLLADVRTCGDLLRGINRRQELRAHDAALLAAARSGPSGDVAAWRASLEPLFGLDDVLDELLERSRSTCDDACVAALLVRLGHLHP